MFGWGVPFVLYLNFFDVGIDALYRVALRVGCNYYDCLNFCARATFRVFFACLWVNRCWRYVLFCCLGSDMFFHFRRSEGFFVIILLYVPVLGSGRRGKVPWTGWPCRHTVR